MESTIENRINILREAMKLNQTEFASKLGLTQSTVSGWRIGKSKLTEQNIKLVCLTFRVNEKWLRYGTGDMFDFDDFLGSDVLDVFRQLSPHGRKAAVELINSLLITEKSLQREPTLDQQKADIPSPKEPLEIAMILHYNSFDELINDRQPPPAIDAERYVSFPKQGLLENPANYFAMRARGFAFTEAGVHEGDRLIFLRTEKPAYGKIQIVSYKNTVSLKQVIARDGAVYLRWEENGAVKETAADPSAFRVLGTLAKSVKDYDAQA